MLLSVGYIQGGVIGWHVQGMVGQRVMYSSVRQVNDLQRSSRFIGDSQDVSQYPGRVKTSHVD